MQEKIISAQRTPKTAQQAGASAPAPLTTPIQVSRKSRTRVPAQLFPPLFLTYKTTPKKVNKKNKKRVIKNLPVLEFVSWISQTSLIGLTNVQLESSLIEHLWSPGESLRRLSLRPFLAAEISLN